MDREASLQIGRADGPEDDLLDGVVSVRKMPAAILVAQQTELRLYGSDGRLVRRLGRAGAGPGEFQQVADVIPCGGRILATEMHPPRLTVFDPSGDARTLPLPAPEKPGVLSPLSPLLACAPGGVVGSMPGPRSSVGESAGIQRHPHLVTRLFEVDARLDTLLSYRGREEHDGLAVPFGRQTLIAASDSLLYLVDTGNAELRVLGLDGRLQRIVRIALPARAVTQADIDRIRALYLYRDRGGLPPGARAEIEARLDAVPIPQTMPHFSSLRLAPDGTAWLRAYQPFRDEEVTRWTIIAPTGEWLGDVELPAGFTAHEFDVDGVLGIWRDANDVEYVRYHAIRRDAGPLLRRLPSEVA